METLNSYLQEGVNAAGNARSIINGQKGDGVWADSWKNFAMQYALQMQQNDANLQLWNLMNEYNSPKAQMQRFKEAGLNPMLAYTQGTPGNAGSQATAGKPDVQIHPNKDVMDAVQTAVSVVGMINNLVGNIGGMIDTGLDIGLKRNDLAWSNTERGFAEKNIVNFGSRTARPGFRVVTAVDPTTGQELPWLPDDLNPFSPDFSPGRYNTLKRLGAIPDYFKGYMTAEAQREYTKFRSQYQDYYNEHLLPLFKRYQTAHAGREEIAYEMDDYWRQSTEMMPPWLRGILMPLFEWLGPMLKVVFKKSSVNHRIK